MRVYVQARVRVWGREERGKLGGGKGRRGWLGRRIGRGGWEEEEEEEEEDKDEEGLELLGARRYT